MGAFLDKPKTEKFNDSGSAAHGTLRYGLASMQGWRVEMEDAHVVRASLPEVFGEAAFFGVFDGHAGTRIARHSAAAILEAILQTEEFQRLQQELQQQSPATAQKLPPAESLPTIVDPAETAAGGDDATPMETMSERRVFSAVETSLQSRATAKNPVENLVLDKRQIDLIVAGIKAGFLSFDNNMRTSPVFYGENERSGTTAVCAFVLPSHIFLANLGDSRGVMSRHGSVLVATEDHKPFMPKERERITRAGGSVMIQRVNGSLAVSRALGDFDYKSVPGIDPCDQLVSPEPDIYVIERDKIPSAVSSPQPTRSSVAGSDEVFLSQEATSSSAASSIKDSSSESDSPPKEGKSSPESTADSDAPRPNRESEISEDTRDTTLSESPAPDSPAKKTAQTSAAPPTPKTAAGGHRKSEPHEEKFKVFGVAAPPPQRAATPPPPDNIRASVHYVAAGRNPTSHVRDEFILLACDGIFDVMTSSELCDFVRQRLTCTDRLDQVCNQILDVCLSKGSKDNMSIVLITLPGAPQVCTEAKVQDEKFAFHVKERIIEIINRRDSLSDIDTDQVLRLLVQQKIPGAPPGAGILAMRNLVETTLESVKSMPRPKQHSPTTTLTAAASSPPTTTTGAASPIATPPRSESSTPDSCGGGGASAGTSPLACSPAAKKFSKS